MLQQHIDLTSQDSIEQLFKLTPERAHALNELLSAAEKEIIENHIEYSCNGGHTLICGKALERLLQIANTPNEEIAIVYTFGELVDRVVSAIADMKLGERSLINKINKDNAANRNAIP